MQKIQVQCYNSFEVLSF